jgi:hypothetical protein
MKSSSAHRWPVCPVTGKQRLRERKDVRLSLEHARRRRSLALVHGAECTWQVIRGYKCLHCSGWHLTSTTKKSSSTETGNHA